MIKKKNILAAAGIYEQGVDIEAQFASIETRLVDLDNGAFVQDTAIDPDTYDQLAASMQADTGAELGKDEDLAGIKRREKYSLVYLVKDGDEGRPARAAGSGQRALVDDVWLRGDRRRSVDHSRRLFL